LIEKAEEEIGEEIVEINDIPPLERRKIVKSLEEQMKEASENLDFELAIKIREQLKEFRSQD
jgi:excinuclease UvrABC nuclease subunit